MRSQTAHANTCDCSVPLHCTLRDALCEAASSGDPNDTIFIDPSVTHMQIGLSCMSGAEDDNVCGDLDVYKNMAGPTQIRIQATGPHTTLSSLLIGAARERLLHVPPPTSERSAPELIIENLKLVGGVQLFTGGPVGGGCLANESDSALRLINSEVVGCLREGAGAGGSFGGGGIYSQGPLELHQSWVGQNISRYASGGGIYATSTVKITGGGIAGNASEQPCPGCSLRGGGLHAEGSAADVTLTSVEFSANVAHYDGGGVAVQGGELIVVGSQFLNNRSDMGRGGGVFVQGPNLSLRQVEVHGNQATVGDGGGVCTLTDALELVDVDVGENVAGESGGGIFALVPELFGDFIKRSSFWFNEAGAKGGGLALLTRSGHSPKFGIINTTFSENEAADEGGALSVEVPSMGSSAIELELDYVTLYRNKSLKSSPVGRDIYASGSAVDEVRFRSVIVYSQASTGDCGGGADVDGASVSANSARFVTSGSGCWATNAAASHTEDLLPLTYNGANPTKLHTLFIHPTDPSQNDPRLAYCKAIEDNTVDQHQTARDSDMGDPTTCGAWQAP